MIPQSKSPVRSRLRAVTHDMHQALHVHPLLARLQAPDLSLAELRANATVSCAAIAIVEGERLHRDIWPSLSLAEHVDALRKQLGMKSEFKRFAGPLKFESDAALLGALYVVHGSALGGAILSKAVKAVLPEAPTSFFVPHNSSTWQYLCGLLETLPETDWSECENGALNLFAYYRDTADIQMQSISASA